MNFLLNFPIIINDKHVKTRNFVIPAKAGIQNYSKTLDCRLRGNDIKGGFKIFNQRQSPHRAYPSPNQPSKTSPWTERRLFG